MMNNVKKDACIVCGAAAVEIQTITQQFAYADKNRDVLLTADVPVEHCQECGEMLLGEQGQIAQHEAVCNYLGRLSPAEIKEIRTGLKLSQQAFAERINAGVASVKRWETGLVIQNASMDSILRQVNDEAALPKQRRARITPVFRTQIKPHMLAASKLFHLRPSG